MKVDRDELFVEFGVGRLATPFIIRVLRGEHLSHHDEAAYSQHVGTGYTATYRS